MEIPETAVIASQVLIVMITIRIVIIAMIIRPVMIVIIAIVILVIIMVIIISCGFPCAKRGKAKGHGNDWRISGFGPFRA